MRSLSPQATYFDENFTTLLVEVEAILNSRPLSPIAFAEGSERPLTSNDLLMVRPDINLPIVETEPSDAFRQRWRQVKFHADLFWWRWVREYLPTLSCRGKWYKKKPNVAVDDVVIIYDEATPRSHWPMGRVTKTYPDQKGMVRTVLVKTKNGGTHS